MRRRLTLAIVGVVIGTLLVATAGSLLLVRRAAVTTARSEITQEGTIVGRLLSEGTLADDIGARAKTNARRILAVLRVVGSYDAFRPVGLTPSGQFLSLPVPLVGSDLDVSALEAGNTVSGSVGDVVFVAVPVVLTARQRVNFLIPARDAPVLVATRTVGSPVNGFVYFVLVAGAALIVAVAVAAMLARRISAPLVRAVATTSRIAHGDLAARVPVGARDDPEFTELATAINAMGDSLGRAQHLEREFLMSVSHELRTPLTSIRGYADAIADGATDDVGAAVEVIGTEARRLERLVQDLLDLARLDTRQFSLHMEPVDCVAMTRPIVDGFRPQADRLGLELATSFPDGDRLFVDGDADRLGQIVANLVENAFKYATARVEVGAARVEAWTVVWVADDGPGIAPEDLAHVFDRHFTSDRAPARRWGSGLGLAIVSELATAMGAVVRPDSPLEAGRGTRMALWLAPRGPATP